MQDLDIRAKAVIDRIIKVDYAGELGAKNIYAAQIKHEANLENRAKLLEMLSDELAHLEYFTGIGKQEQVRPSILHGVMNVGAKALGFVSGKAGFHSMMAATVGVEEVIQEHYAMQIQELQELIEILPESSRYYKITRELHSKILQFIDEEKKHHDSGLEYCNNSFRYDISYKISKYVSKIAIKLVSIT